MKHQELRSLIREEVRKILTTKPKTVGGKGPAKKGSLKEGYAWERKPGQPLPTLKDVQDAYKKKLKTEEKIHQDTQDKENIKRDLWKEEEGEDNWYKDENGGNDLDSSKGGTDNSMNAIHGALTKLQKQIDKLLTDYKNGIITKDIYIAKRKPLQQKRDKLENAL